MEDEKKEHGVFKEGLFVEKLRQMLGMDIRSLAFFRIGMAIATIGDLCERSLDLRDHYSDEGIFPRHVLYESYTNNYTIHVHGMSGHPNFQALVFLVHAFCALCMLVGWHTRIFTTCCWLLLVSLQARNPFLNHGGDLYFRLLFFYAIFLPLGGCFSVDSAIEATKTKLKAYRNPRVFTGGTVALMAQVVIMYMVSTFHKTGSEWTTDYTSTWYALQLDYYRTSIAALLDNFHELLKFLTWFVFKWEFWGNFCFFMPVFTDYFRLLAVLGYFGMHLGFILCIRLGFFFWVCAVAMFPFVPTLVWETIKNTKAMRTAAQRAHAIQIRFDNHSRFSRMVAHLVCTFFVIPFTRLSTFSLELEDFHSDDWLQVECNGKVTKNLDAVFTAFENSLAFPPTYPLRVLIRPLRKPLAKIGAFVMHPIAKSARNCHVASHEHAVPPKVPRKKRRIRLGDVFILLCIVFVIHWNAANLGSNTHLPFQYNWMGIALHLDQFWGMFSPHPPKAHWYYVIQAYKDTGEEFELFRNEGLFKLEGNTPFSFDKPYPFHTSFKNHRWYKFFEMGFNGDKHENIRLAFGRWVCREYNAQHFGADRLYSYKVWFLLEWQTLYGGRAPPTKQVLWEHMCYVKQ